MSYISRWFIGNPIAAKIFMLVIVLGGFLSYPLLPKVFFPDAEIDLIRVSVVYPGAGPDEIESQITQRVEEAVEQLGGIEEIRSTSREGLSEVIIEIQPEEDTQRILNDVRANVDSITTFPASAERPQIVEIRWRTTVMILNLAGAVSERELKELGESLREELAVMPEVDIAELKTPRDYEVSIEIREDRLAEYDIGFDQVAAAIKSYSFDLPVGKIRDAGGDVQLQTRVQADSPLDFASIPIVRELDGGVLRLGDLANVIDGFADVDTHSELDGRNALELHVISQSSPDILKTSDRVREFIQQKNLELPDNVELNIWVDMSDSYRGRLDTLLKNGAGGLVLVFIILMFFLKPVLAFWVCAGIAVAFLGAVWWLSFTPTTLNVLSMFAFIMILGIVVDDALIIGESVYSEQQRLGDMREGAISGVTRMISPVAIAVISTIIFFVPFFYLSDTPKTADIATPVILALIFSLIESLFLLPSHLAQIGAWREHIPQALQSFLSNLFRPVAVLVVPLGRAFESVRKPVSESLPHFARTTYRRWILKSVTNKTLTLLLFFVAFFASVAITRGGWIPFYFTPRVTTDFVSASATLPESAPYNQTFALMKRIEESGENLRRKINNEFDQAVIKRLYSNATENRVDVKLQLDSSSDRPLDSREVAQQWRAAIGEVYGVTDLKVSYTLFDLPRALGFDVRSQSQEQLVAYSEQLVEFLAAQPGVYDARSSLENPSSEINFHLTPSAEVLSISMRDIANQIRQAFYGEEVQRIPRQREDVKVFVRYPREERSYEEVLLAMDILAPSGERIPLDTAVELSYRDTYKKIERVDGMRVARVSAEVQRGFPASDISVELLEYAQYQLSAQFPDVKISITGEEEEKQLFFKKLLMFFTLAMIVIYGLMAVIFRSYWQPILVLSAVPFGFMGAIFGHVIFSVDLSMLSFLGMLACAGVVVNDNVVLIDRINQLRAEGFSARRSVVDAGIQRFRPIVLTSITTFLGLTPILFETSVQAQFLIPMVVSLSFGVMFATSVTLLFVPTLYLVAENTFSRLGGSKRLLPDS